MLSMTLTRSSRSDSMSSTSRTSAASATSTISPHRHHQCQTSVVPTVETIRAPPLTIERFIMPSSGALCRRIGDRHFWWIKDEYRYQYRYSLPRMTKVSNRPILHWPLTHYYTACMFHANFMHYTESDNQKLGGPIHCRSPQPKSWGTCLPRSPWLLRLWPFGQNLT